MKEGEFFVRDRENPSQGWICVVKVIDELRQVVPLDYVRRPNEEPTATGNE
jgi:hypothetical protein